MKRMKWITCILLVAVLLSGMFLPAQAAQEKETIIYLADGTYAVVTLSVGESRNYEKNARKTYTFYNATDVKQWSATLYATFTWGGTEYTATACSIDINIYDTSWREISKTTSMGGRGAAGEVAMGRKVLGITINRETVNITLTCSPDGVIS